MDAGFRSAVEALPLRCPKKTVSPKPRSRLRSTVSTSPRRTLTDSPVLTLADTSACDAPAARARRTTSSASSARRSSSATLASAVTMSMFISFFIQDTLTRAAMQDREEEQDERPSRSARRREALDVLAFAKQLSELPPARLAKLELPDDVRDELAEVQRTPSHIAHKRQLAHLAKLMRAHDEETF